MRILYLKWVCEYTSIVNLASMCGSKGLMSTLTPTDRPVQILISENQMQLCGGYTAIIWGYNTVIWDYNTNMINFNWDVRCHHLKYANLVVITRCWEKMNNCSNYLGGGRGLGIAPPGANPSICVRQSQLTRRPGRQFAKAKITNKPTFAAVYLSLEFSDGTQFTKVNPKPSPYINSKIIRNFF